MHRGGATKRVGSVQNLCVLSVIKKRTTSCRRHEAVSRAEARKARRRFNGASEPDAGASANPAQVSPFITLAEFNQSVEVDFQSSLRRPELLFR